MQKSYIDKLMSDNSQNHENYLSENNKLVTDYNNIKDRYNNQINIINAEKISMRDELRKLYDFLSFIGGELERKVSIVDFVEEEPAKNMSDDAVQAVDIYGIRRFSTKKRAEEIEKSIYWKSIDYKQNLKKKQQAIAKMGDCEQIAEIYRNTIVMLRDAIRDKIIPEFEYIKAFLVADAIREKYVAGKDLVSIKPCRITEYKDTRYNSHYQFVKNTFDFLDLCKVFFSKAILTELLGQEEITEEQRREFNRSIDEFYDRLALLEGNMEVTR